MPPLTQAGQDQLAKMPVVKELRAEEVRDGKGGTKKVVKISALESSQSDAAFTDKVETEKNYNVTRHLMKNGKKMSSILWELSLRH